VALSAIDLGQGMKSVTRQIAAETLGVPVEDVYVDTADSDTGPHDMGSFASRGTHRMGNAVIRASAGGPRGDAGGRRRGTGGRPRRSRHRRARQHPRQGRAVAVDHHHGRRAGRAVPQGRTIAGRGIFLIPLSEVDPDTGEMTPVTTFAHAAMLVEVEVDDETGEVTVTDMQSAYEVGRALNPRWSSSSCAAAPGWACPTPPGRRPNPITPTRDHGPVDFNTYLMPGPGDLAPHHISVLERPAEDGPFGGKGPGEMCANPVLPAVVNAVYDAVGVRIDELAGHAREGAARAARPGRRPAERRL
jgi:CO/xanthine dehydrogenase Mo-binding subunit